MPAGWSSAASRSISGSPSRARRARRPSPPAMRCPGAARRSTSPPRPSRWAAAQRTRRRCGSTRPSSTAWAPTCSCWARRPAPRRPMRPGSASRPAASRWPPARISRPTISCWPRRRRCSSATACSCRPSPTPPGWAPRRSAICASPATAPRCACPAGPTWPCCAAPRRPAPRNCCSGRTSSWMPVPARSRSTAPARPGRAAAWPSTRPRRRWAPSAWPWAPHAMRRAG